MQRWVRIHMLQNVRGPFHSRMMRIWNLLIRKYMLQNDSWSFWNCHYKTSIGLFLKLAYQKTCASKWLLIILELTLQNQHRFVLLLVRSQPGRKHANANLLKGISYLLLNNDLVFKREKKDYKIDNGLHCSLMLQHGQITGVLRKYLSNWQLISIRL